MLVKLIDGVSGFANGEATWNAADQPFDVDKRLYEQELSKTGYFEPVEIAAKSDFVAPKKKESKK